MTSQTLFALFAVLVCYLIGGISFAFLIARANGVDLRKVGSGNLGATNLGRGLGKRFARVCFLLDFAKGALPVAIVGAVFGPAKPWVPAVAGAATIAGHVWPVALGFRGGKGVATALGVSLGLTLPAFLAAVLVWLATFYSTRFVSLASILAALALPVVATLLLTVGVPSLAPSLSAVLLMWVLGVLIVVAHRSNIRRLLKGEENRSARR